MPNVYLTGLDEPLLHLKSLNFSKLYIKMEGFCTMPDELILSINIALLIVALLGGAVYYLIYKTVKEKNVNLKETMFYPLLIAGILYIFNAITEILKGLIPYTDIIHHLLMFLVALVMLGGFYSYYKMLKKLPS